VAVRHAKDAPSRRLLYGPALEEIRSPLLVVELHRAVENGEFVPFFQPIYRHREGRWYLAGAEVLLRWQHPQRGLLAPASFLQLLERLSICKSVGWHVLDQGLRNAVRWREVVEDFTIWVNLFPLQALDPECSERIRTAIEATRSLPQSLVVEITERVVVNAEQEVVELARKLRSFGASMAIDDFGTGGSSLARIREVPAQILKIDKSFVNRSEVDSKAMAVASAVARLASELGMSVVAEGAESWLQVKSMAEIGCDYCQGYALGHPAPVELFERFVTRDALDERAAETAAGRDRPIIVQ
jgi:EAL domain-containing protein (putative c-di-GMP-specific phosphodiesterase class I)